MLLLRKINLHYLIFFCYCNICILILQVFVPVVGDQPANAKEAERLGFGVMLPYQEITEKKVEEALNLILTDQKYTNRAKEFGALAADQIQHPLEKACWWLEHIMRHPHEYRNKSPVFKLAWYQYFCLDVIFFIAFVVFLMFYIIYKMISLCRYFCGRKQKRE